MSVETQSAFGCLKTVSCFLLLFFCCCQTFVGPEENLNIAVGELLVSTKSLVMLDGTALCVLAGWDLVLEILASVEFPALRLAGSPFVLANSNAIGSLVHAPIDEK